MHIWEDAYLAEIINPQSGEPAAEGEVGELVITLGGERRRRDPAGLRSGP